MALPGKLTHLSTFAEVQEDSILGSPNDQPRDGSSTLSSKNPYRLDSTPDKQKGSVHVRSTSNTDSSEVGRARRKHQSSHRSDAFGPLNSERRSEEMQRGSPQPNSRPRRSSSLRERYPGDQSLHPLEQIRRETKLANRSPHLKKKHIPGPDTIDQLDATGGLKYHHAGPYDAALLARNNSYESSPVAALDHSNREALKATPRENVRDAVDRHRPLDGVASIPPGSRDQFGRLYEYEEGPNMMIVDGGDYKRWPGVQYHPDDIKGKGEPSFTIERSLKQREEGMPRSSQDGASIELVERPHMSQDYSEWEEGRRGTGSSVQRFSGELKRRIGSLRKKDKGTTTA